MGYDRWAAKHNLKQMAATVTAYQQYGFSSPEELDEACSAAYTAMRESLTELKQMEKTLNGKKELQRQVLAYSKTRPVRDGLKQQKNAKAKAAYRQKYESDFIIADAAARYFRENGISKLPSYKALQAEIETLIQEKNSGYNDYRAKREEYRRLQTVKGLSLIHISKDGYWYYNDQIIGIFIDTKKPIIYFNNSGSIYQMCIRDSI